MTRARGSIAGLVPVGFVAMLGVFAAAGATLYVSSAGTAATVQQLSETCRADAALVLPIPPDVSDAPAAVAAIGDQVPASDSVRHGASAVPVVVTPKGTERRMTLLYLDGIGEAVTPALAPLAMGEIAMSRLQATLLGVHIGDELTTTDGPRLRVAQIFDDVPIAPIPDLWCGFEGLVLPNLEGDPPPPSAIAAPGTITQFGSRASEVLEYRVIDGPVTLSHIEQVLTAHRRAVDEWNTTFVRPPGPDSEPVPYIPGSPPGFPQPDVASKPIVYASQLLNVVARAEAVTATVERSLAPVRVTSLLAIFGVLVAASVLLANERRRELRLMVLRGRHPAWVGGGVVPGVAAATGIAAMIGFAFAWWTVTSFGPSAHLESSALVEAATYSVMVAVVGVVVVAATVAFVADRTVDPPVRRLHRGWLLSAPALLLVGGAVWSFRRLDDGGAIRVSGVTARGGDLLALGFPLAMLLSSTVVVAAFLVWLIPMLRRSGARWPRSIRLGWRRVVLESGPTVAALAAAALAAGSFVSAASLADGARRQFHDKAEVYVGSDLAVNVYDDPVLPPDVARRSSVTWTASGKWSGGLVDLVGVDPTTYAHAAKLRSDAGDLQRLLELLAPDGTAALPPAIGSGSGLSVGDIVEVSVVGADGPIAVRLAAVTPFFPGKSTGSALIALDQQVVRSHVPIATRQLLVRDPPPDLVATLRAAGVRTGVVLDAASTFDASNFSGVRWAYRPLVALGVLFAFIAAAVQLLVVAARRDTRRAAHLVMRRTGIGRRSLMASSAIEAGMPLLVGVIVGVGAAVTSAALAVPRLDPMPLLQPPAAFAMPWPTVLGIALVVPCWAAVLALFAVHTTVSGDPMRVLRGEL